MSNSNTLSTCLRNMVNVGPLTAEICSLVWGAPANFNRFRVLASLLQQRRSPNFARCLAVSWAGTLYIFFFGSSCPLTAFCQVQNSLCVQVLRSPILAALLRGTRAVCVSRTLRRGIFTRQGGHAVRHWAVELSSLTCFAGAVSVVRRRSRYAGADGQ